MSSKQTSQKWITQNGRTLILPAWKGGQTGGGKLTLSDVDIRDTYSIQRYPVGTKLIDGERVFYYAKTTATGITNADLAVKQGFAQHVAYAAVKLAQAKGDKSLTVYVGAADGIAGDGVIAVNELAGGFCIIFGHDSDASCHRILENPVVDGAANMIITLQDEINATLVADSDHCECMANPWSGCETNTDGEKPVLGVAQSIVAASSWFWLQTWGPCWIAPQGEVGDAAHDHQVVFRHDGSVDEHDYSDAYNVKQQHAGFTLAHAYGGGQGAAFIMLQICP